MSILPSYCVSRRKRFRGREKRFSLERARESGRERVRESGRERERLRLREGWDVELTRLRVKGRDKDWR
jgi:hypothetical protein